MKNQSTNLPFKISLCPATLPIQLRIFRNYNSRARVTGNVLAYRHACTLARRSVIVQAEKSDRLWALWQRWFVRSNSLLLHRCTAVSSTARQTRWPILHGQMNLRINVNNLAGERRRATGDRITEQEPLHFRRTFSSPSSPPKSRVSLRNACGNVYIHTNACFSSLRAAFVARRQNRRIDQEMCGDLRNLSSSRWRTKGICGIRLNFEWCLI